MEKEFIPYEQALALKELRFDKPCLALYVSLLDGTGEFELIKLEKQNNKLILAPLYQQIFRWFREKYNLNANVYKWQPDFAKSMNHLEWEGSVTHFTEKKVGGSEYFNTYEEAELECLKKLIEIVKNK